MHQLQKVLLKRLTLQNKQKYGTLAAGYDFEDNIVFHLNQLLKEGLIEKENGIYAISLKGIKEIANYEPVQLEGKGAKTFFIGFLCQDKQENFLIKSHPQAETNFYNLPSGKPYFGEGIAEALTRTFLFNTGLNLPGENFNFLSLHLKTIQTSQNEVLFDDAFTIYSIQISDNQKEEIKLLNSVQWMSRREIKSLPNKWPEIDICIINKDFSVYQTYTHTSDYIL
jgi:hypothetical protein